MPRQRNFWLLWGGSTTSNLGDGIRLAALPLLTTQITTDPLAVGAVSAVSFLPWILLSLVGGAIADRHDRRKLILLGQAVRGAAVLAFAALVWNGSESLVAIYLIALVIGSGEVIVDSCMQAAIPNVAGADLDKANSRFASGQFLAGEVAGAPLGAALFGVTASLPFFVDGATFLLGAVLISAIHVPLQETDDEPSTTSILDDIKEGAQFLANQKVLRGMVLAVSLSNLADAAVGALLVLLVIDILGASGFAFGLVLAVGALGGFVGSAMAARIMAIVGRRRALVGSFALLAAAQGAIGLAPNVPLVGIGSFLVLFAIAVFNVCGQSIRQRLTPNRLLGRVIATMRFVAFGAVPIGALGGGAVARWIGVRETIMATVVIGAIATVAMAIATAGEDLEGSHTPSGEPSPTS